MPATVKLVLRKDKPKADGTCPVWLRVTANRRSKYRSTKVWVGPKHWNDRTQRVRSGHPLADKFNSELQKVLLSATAIAIEADTAEQVIGAVGSSGSELTAFLEAFIAQMERDNRFQDAKKYSTTLRKVKAFWGPAVGWKAINHRSLREFQKFLKEEKGNGVNTIRKELQRLHRTFLEAIGRGLLRPESDPFHGFRKPRAKKVVRRRLSYSELERIAAAPIEANSGLELARDLFLFAFYAGGMRFGDICRLRVEQIQGGRIDYVMSETGTRMSLPLPDMARPIVERHLRPAGYLFPMLDGVDPNDPIATRRRISSRNVVINRHLKEVAKKSGLGDEGISMHIARHSFADFARRRSKDIYGIGKMLGHADISVTQTYLDSFDQDAVDDFAEALWTPVS